MIQNIFPQIYSITQSEDTSSLLLLLLYVYIIATILPYHFLFVPYLLTFILCSFIFHKWKSHTCCIWNDISNWFSFCKRAVPLNPFLLKLHYAIRVNKNAWILKWKRRDIAISVNRSDSLQPGRRPRARLLCAEERVKRMCV